MKPPLRILHLDDTPNDAELIQAALETEGIISHVTRVETQADFFAALEQGGFDLILADYTFPSFNGLSALQIALEKCPDVPFIFVSGTLGEEAAIEALKIGARDYLLKERLSRIVPSVHRALREAQERAERKRAEALRAGEKRLLEMIAKGNPLSTVLDALCRLVEELSEASLSSILLLDPDGHRLRHGAAPSLPKSYTDAIDGGFIGPAAGSCGTAAYRKAPVIVSDIAQDPLWADYRDLALPHGLRACWSTPILASDGRVLGTFAIYYREPKSPTPEQQNIIEQITDLASIAIERRQAEEERQAHLWFLESMDRVNRAVQGTNDLEQMMSDVLDAVLSVFHCDRSCLVYPCDPDAASWKVPMEHTRPEFPGAFALGLELPVDPEIAKMFQTVRASSSAVRLGPASDHPLPAEAAKRFSIQSMMAMALYPKGDKPYMLGLHQCSYPRAWTPQEERLFQEVGRRLEDALTSLLMFRSLGESERKLEEAQRVTHVGYWERDLDRDVITWSDETFRIFGRRPQERTLNLAQLSELVHPEDKQVVIGAVAEALRGGRRYDVEYRVIRPNGEVRFVHSQGDIRTDDAGRPRRMFGTVQDITERKRAEHRLMAQHTVTQVLAEAATLAEATPRILRAVCEGLGWDLGALWRNDREAGVLRCVEVWHKESLAVPEFEAASRGSTFRPGVGLPGRVWLSREPTYIPDVVRDSNFPRAPIAAREALHAAFGFPILLGSEVLGAMEFFSREIRPSDRDLLHTMATIGSQIGQFIERKQAEEALRRSEAYLSEAQKLSHTGNFGWNVASGELLWSDETYRIAGLDRAMKPTIAQVLQRVHPEDVVMVQRALDRAARAGTDLDFEHRLVMAEGSVKHVHVVARALRDEKGHLEYVGAVTDVTAIKKAEEKTRQNERELRQIVDFGPQFIIVMAPDGRYLYANQRVLDYTGYSQEDVVAGNFRERVFHPEDVERLREERREALARGVPFELEQRARRKDGQYRWILIRFNPLREEQGRVIRWYAMGIDIDDRKRAEENLRRSEGYLAEAQRLTHTGSYAWSVVTREIIYWSREVYRLWGFDPEAGIPTFEAFRQRIHPDDRAAAAEVLERTIREGVDNEILFRALLPDGTVRCIRSVGHPVFDPSGGVIEVIGTNMDVTESQRAQEALERTQAELAHVTRVATLGELTASIAHEVNQPLGAIVNNASACLRWLAAQNLEEARQSAARVIADGHRASQIIGRIRALAKKTPPQKEWLDINDTLREAIALAHSEVQRNRVALQTRLSEDAPPVRADRIQLQQVVLNLIINAIEAMSGAAEGPRELWVMSEKVESTAVRIAVRDSGPGLDAQGLDHLFEAFYTTKPHGLGMGLAISRSIVEAHGGRLWATANDGRGATFQFTLPTEGERAS